MILFAATNLREIGIDGNCLMPGDRREQIFLNSVKFSKQVDWFSVDSEAIITQPPQLGSRFGI
jgi:hypothetical protein